MSWRLLPRSPLCIPPSGPRWSRGPARPWPSRPRGLMPTTATFSLLPFLSACLFSRPPKYASSASTGPDNRSRPVRASRASRSLCGRYAAELCPVPRSRSGCTPDMPFGCAATRCVATAHFRWLILERSMTVPVLTLKYLLHGSSSTACQGASQRRHGHAYTGGTHGSPAICRSRNTPWRPFRRGMSRTTLPAKGPCPKPSGTTRV